MVDVFLSLNHCCVTVISGDVPQARAAEITICLTTVGKIALDPTWHIAAVYNSIIDVYVGLVVIIADVQLTAVR